MTNKIEIENAQDKMAKFSKELANFVALFEQSDDKFSSRIIIIEKQVAQLKTVLKKTSDDIHNTLNEVQEVMSAAGAARWRVAAEESLKLGHHQVEQLQNLIKQFNDLSGRNLVRLEQLTVETEKRVVKTLSKIAIEQNEIIDGFRDRIEKRFNEIEKVGSKTINYLHKMGLKFRVEQIVLAALVSIITAFLMSLYINAEFPWESFHHAKMERAVGKSVIQQQQKE